MLHLWTCIYRLLLFLILRFRFRLPLLSWWFCMNLLSLFRKWPCFFLGRTNPLFWRSFRCFTQAFLTFLSTCFYWAFLFWKFLRRTLWMPARNMTSRMLEIIDHNIQINSIISLLLFNVFLSWWYLNISPHFYIRKS